MFPPSNRLRVAALVDLPRSPQSGGHVKCWERLAAAAAQSKLPLDLTVYFSGDGPDEILGPHTRLRHLPPVFSTARLKFLPYVPDHTDLASRHVALERELPQYDILHTTDGFFAFAQTADRVSRRLGIPLITSFHTDTPTYTKIFCLQAIEKIFRRWPRVKQKLIDDWKIPQRQSDIMQRKLERHIRATTYTLVTREEDYTLAAELIGNSYTRRLRLGVDKMMFGPHRRDRDGVLRDYNIPPDRKIILFVGRVDVGKNIHTLIHAMEKLISEGMPIHLITAGAGPATADIKKHLGEHASLPGFVTPLELARLYASVDALALCSEVEIRSMAGVEAMASGCPALVASKSGVMEVFEHTPAMQSVDNGINGWAEAIRTFLGNHVHEALMREAALTYSRTHLASWEDVLAEDLFAIWTAATTDHQRQAA